MAQYETITVTANVSLPLAEKRDVMTREALADVDAELVCDPLVVQAWIDSLGTDKPLSLLC